jgi:hypothetical protein
MRQATLFHLATEAVTGRWPVIVPAPVQELNRSADGTHIRAASTRSLSHYNLHAVFT